MPTKPLPPSDLAEVLTRAQLDFKGLRHAQLFITGGTGFFGHWLLESLLHANAQLGLGVRATVLTRNTLAFAEKSPHIAGDPAITLLEGDIRTFAFPAQPHTHIVHAATDTGGRPSDRPAYHLAESIIDGTRRILQFARATGAARLLYISSGAVYGRSTALPHTPETFGGSPDPIQLASAYDEGKRMAEHLCIAYAHDTPLEVVVARCFAFVGPHLPLDAHFAIGNFIGAVLEGRPIHIRSDGTPRRSWLYMSDLAVWLWALLARGQPSRAYNVGSDEAYTIAEVAHLVAETLQSAAEVDSLPQVKIDGTPDPSARLNSYVPDITRAREELQLRVSVPLDEAIRRTAAWHGFPDNGRKLNQP